MRTAFNVEDDTGELVQDIRPTPNHEWVCTAIEDDSALENAIATVEHQVYDLQGGRTSSFMLCTLSEQVHYLIVGYHHIILDGTAWQIVLRDVLSMYSSGEVLPLARMQYRHYALDGEEDSEDHRACWKAHFATVPSTLPLFPFAETAYRFPIQTPSIHTFEEAVPVHITEQVMMACRKLGIRWVTRTETTNGMEMLPDSWQAYIHCDLFWKMACHSLKLLDKHEMQSWLPWIMPKSLSKR